MSDRVGDDDRRLGDMNYATHLAVLYLGADGLKGDKGSQIVLLSTDDSVLVT